MITSRLSSPDYEKRLAPVEHAVNSAEARARVVWLTLTSLSAYVLVVFLATSHEDMLLRSRQKLPILQIELPLEAFALIGPGLLLLVHLMTLINVLYIKDALGDYCSMLNATDSKSARSASWSRIASGIFIRGPGLPVPATLRGAQWLLETITVWLAPPVIVLFCQLRFLPYHDPFITWIHRTILTLDVIFVAIAAVAAWRYIAKRQAGAGWRPMAAVVPRALPGACVLVGVCFLSFFVFQHRQDQSWNPLPRCGQDPCLIKRLFGEGISSAKALSSGRPFLYRDIYAPASQAVADTAEKLVERSYSISLRFRDLEGADLQGGRFYKVDFRGANLRSANLRDADLREALFSCFHNPDGFVCTTLQFADLSDALVQGADFTNAKAQGAVFGSWESHGTQLQRSRFFAAQLAGAFFYGDLSGADFHYASLTGASMSTYVAGASFTGADLSYADLSGAVLIGADFDGSQIKGADLTKAWLWHASGIPELTQDDASITVDCRDVSMRKFTSAGYKSFLDDIHTVPATLDRPFLSYPELDPANTQPRDSNGQPIADKPKWLSQCDNYVASKQDVELARQYVGEICSDSSEIDTSVDFAAMWPRHGIGRFKLLDSEPPKRPLLLGEFYRSIFDKPECARVLARIRARDPATVDRDLFHEIWKSARLVGIDSGVITAALGPCDDCKAITVGTPTASK